MKNTNDISGIQLLNTDRTELIDLLTILLHLTTCYAIYPCKPLADSIGRHLEYLSQEPANVELREWLPIVDKLQVHWRSIAQKHRDDLHRNMAEIRDNIIPLTKLQ